MGKKFQVLLFMMSFLIGAYLKPVAQTPKIEALKKMVSLAQDPKQKLQALFSLCEERFSLNADSLFTYAAIAKAIATEQNNQFDIARANYYLYSGLLRNGLYDSLLKAVNTDLSWMKKNDGPWQLLMDLSYLKAQALVRSNRLKEALSTYYDLLHQAETRNDLFIQIKSKTGIGWVNMELNQHREAITWFQNALSTSSDEKLYKKYGVLYSNLASSYNNIGKYDSAFFFIRKAIFTTKEEQQLSYLANSLNIEADIYMNIKNNVAAEQDLNQALEIRKQVGDPFYIVSDLTQLANFYAIVGQPEKGVFIAQQGVAIALTHNLVGKLPILYTALALNYKLSGNYLQCAEVQEKLMALKDSMYEKNSAESLADLQSKYDLQKKENTIIQQRLDIIRKDYLYFATLGIFFFLSVIAFILYRSYNKRQRIKMDKLVEEQSLKQTIAVIKAEEKERKRIAADLHDNLGAYAAAMSANVQSFRELQTGHQNHPITKRLEKNAQDMVSELANTIWVLKKESQQLTEISDRLKVWMQKLMHNYPNIQYDFYEHIENDVALSPSNALHLFHMLQECINNALRHSQCTQVAVYLISKDGWEVQVGDNGKGFDAQSIVYGNGLHNLTDRAHACGWSLAIKQQSAGGTLVTISSQTT